MRTMTRTPPTLIPSTSTNTNSPCSYSTSDAAAVTITKSTPVATLTLFSVFLGLLMAGNNVMFSHGLLYLPKFSPLIFNSLVLLTFSAILLAFHTDSDDPTGVSAAGLFASAKWMRLKVEMEGNGKGRVSYVMILAWNAVDWQSNFVETVALSFWVSSLFTMVISTMALPIVLVLAAVFFHDKMDGMNILALFIAIWGFLSYIYQHYLDDLNPRQELMGLNYLMLLLTMVKIR
ncbi:hypothetical protein MRB53_025353 [Persea americana]|uniref:Uncharacterized protein n=1 Tax=Persea americana TaxID=3435 RepID=A0ACC2LF73_PERAE|nr:hypothetical protein MRB53_025353 [Persea americana]